MTREVVWNVQGRLGFVVFLWLSLFKGKGSTTIRSQAFQTVMDKIICMRCTLAQHQA